MIDFLNQLFLPLSIIFFLPLLWTGIVYFFSKKRSPEEPGEKIFFSAMLAPSLIGLALIIFFALSPSSLSITALDLPLLPDLAEGGATGEAAALPAASLVIPFGAIISAAYLAITPLFLIRLIIACLELGKISSSAHLLEEVEREDILVTEQEISPLAHISGKVILPRLLLETFPHKDIELIIAHERAHIARGDAPYFLIMGLVDAFFWFNPFLRYQTRKCRLAAEIACDTRVTDDNPTARKDYARAIITTLEMLAPKASPIAATFLNHEKSGEFRMRINSIMHADDQVRSKLPKKAMAIAAALLLPLSTLQVALAGSDASGEVNFSVMPLAGKITSPFGERTDPINQKKRTHWGTDIKAAMGTPIAAPADGIVAKTQDLPDSYGLLLTIDHGNGYQTRYANLSAFNVKEGDKVKAGDVIALVGSTGRSTGPHLHIEVIKDGEHVDPATLIKLPSKD